MSCCWRAAAPEDELLVAKEEVVYGQLSASSPAAFRGAAGVVVGEAKRPPVVAATPAAQREDAYAPLALREERPQQARGGRFAIGALEPASAARPLARAASLEPPPPPPPRIVAAADPAALPLSPADASQALPTSPTVLPYSPSGSVFSAGFSPALSPPPPAAGFSSAFTAPPSRTAGAGPTALARLSPLEEGELS